jgi:hypothetical protein
VILPAFLCRIQKHFIRKFWTEFAEKFHNISKKSTKITNKNFMIFQTRVRKYVGIHENSKGGYFVRFYQLISIKKSEKMLDSNFS